jgi:hypothetical protein
LETRVGHPITERKLKQSPNGTPVEYLMQRNFITVLEPFRAFDSSQATGLPIPGREMPLKSVRITTLTTLPLDQPITTSAYPIFEGQPFEFHILAKDADGQDHDFRMPLMFVPADTDSGATRARLHCPIAGCLTGDSGTAERMV